MMGKTHRIVGIVTVLFFGLMNPTIQIFGTLMYPLVGLLVADFASKIADVDLGTTQYGHKYPIASKIFSHRGFTHTGLIVLLQILFLYFVCDNTFSSDVELILIAILVNSSVVATIGIKILKHSRILKKFIFLMPVFTILILYLISYFNPMLIHMALCSLLLGFIIAYASHILSDLCNKKGVPLFFPVSTKKFHVMCVKTNTSEETVFAFFFVVIATGLFYFISKGGF